MIMVAESLPDCKGFLKPASHALSDASTKMIARCMVAFLLRCGRMSCLQAAGALRCDPRHRAQVSRFLARPRWQGVDINSLLRQDLLDRESSRGQWIFIIDATLCGHAGKKTENTFWTGNRNRRPCEGRRYGKYKHARRSCHSFTMGLLITPSGVRIPFSKPFYTREYCQKKGLTHRTTAEAAADLIRELPLPEGASVVVLGDTAYDAEVVRAACADRHYTWIFPSNPERVLAGPQGKRPKVRSLLKDWSKWSRQTVRLVPARGKYAVYRRLSSHRIGPKLKARTYYVHEEKRSVHSVGEIRLVFSTTKANLKTASPDDVKILTTNDPRLSVRDVIELYSLRWQIELFFKELKSTLGFHQYKFQRFKAVVAWTELALTTFLYLEWFRRRQLARRSLTDKEKRWWRCQRTHGLCQAVRLGSQRSELRYLADRLETPGGIRKLERLLRNGFATEYRAAL